MEFEKIRQIIAEQLGKEESEIAMETSFNDDLGADSLDLFQIISELEEAFDMEFPQDDLEKIKTVGDAVNYIQSAQ
ncbi:MAG: acyl carrier protein [Defluviitaleaceae bacterium]|nr:acyl carrier protein [Defluviitaleaceae bacterium]